MKHPKAFNTDASTSKRMANVKLKGGPEERALAKALWHKGYRYRLNYKKLPGSPDIAIQRYKIAVFIDGEFWHGYDWENKKQKIQRNREYWIEKIEENIARDNRVNAQLLEQDWVPIRFWSKVVQKDLKTCIAIIENAICQQSL